MIFEGDSLVLINQVLNEDCYPDWLIECEVATIRQFLMEPPSWKLQWTPHEGNEMAHWLAHRGFLSSSTGDLALDSIPLDIVLCDGSALSSRAYG